MNGKLNIQINEQDGDIASSLLTGMNQNRKDQKVAN